DRTARLGSGSGFAVRFKADENLPNSAIELLRDAGHEVKTVLDEQLGGHSDTEVFAAATNERRTFITLDKDFADIRTYPPAQSAGIMVVRGRDQRLETILAAINRVKPILELENITGSLWIVDD